MISCNDFNVNVCLRLCVYKCLRLTGSIVFCAFKYININYTFNPKHFLNITQNVYKGTEISKRLKKINIFTIMQKIRPIEIFLIEFILFSLLWLWDDYIASMLTIVFSFIFFFILVISLMVELVERSKVPRWYFTLMAVSIFAPIAAAFVFIFFMGADFEWLSIP